MSKYDLTAQRLREVLQYNQETGVFTRRIRAGGTKAGDIAGGKHNCGYLQISINNSLYLAHRLAWLHVHEVWPINQIDHIDGNRLNNSIENLQRICTHMEQAKLHGQQESVTRVHNLVVLAMLHLHR